MGGNLTIKGLVRALVHSAEHQIRFIDNQPPPQIVKILYNHLLARRPRPKELQEWSHIVKRDGAAAVKDRIMDGKEYNDRFGEDEVPFPQPPNDVPAPGTVPTAGIVPGYVPCNPSYMPCSNTGWWGFQIPSYP